MKIKIISLNIQAGELIDQAVDFIKRENPDILMLQEVFNEEPRGGERLMPNNYTELRERLGLPHSVYAPEIRVHEYAPLFRKDSGNDVNGLWGKAIFAKFPLEMIATVNFNGSFTDFYRSKANGDWSRVPRTMQHAVADVDGTKINILNVHGVWGEDGEDNELRTHMINTIIEYVQGKENIILAGDFNFKPHTQAIKSLEQHLDYVFKDDFESGKLISTFNMRRKTKPGYATAVVDLMFVSPNLKVVSKSIPDVDVSDHYPLIVELER